MAYDAGLTSGLMSEAASRTAGFVTLGTRDLVRAQRFYDYLAREIGVGRTVETDHVVAWGHPGFGVALSEFAPLHGRSAAPLQAEDPEQVQRLYDLALAHGGAAEGAPCDLGNGMYAAYFRDPDGNRLNAFCMTEH